MDWTNSELMALKDELRDRVAAVSERERALGKWEHELDRREARLEKQRASLRRRRREVLLRLLRLRGQGRGTPMPIPEVSPNGGPPEPALENALQESAAQAAKPEQSARGTGKPAS
jgi:hypothetical protein